MEFRLQAESFDVAAFCLKTELHAVRDERRKLQVIL